MQGAVYLYILLHVEAANVIGNMFYCRKHSLGLWIDAFGPINCMQSKDELIEEFVKR